jgi:RNA polymerase sigma factor
LSRFSNSTSQLIDDDNSLEKILNLIQSGNKSLKEQLIRNYKPFVKKIILEVTGMEFCDNIESKDEFSIALIAFNEAVDRFEMDRNVNFLTYAAIVIKNRLLNYIKSNNRNKNIYPMSYFEDESILNSGFSNENICLFEEEMISIEIDCFKEKIRKFKITIEDLVDSSPKHVDSRKLCIEIAKKVADDRELFYIIDQKNIFPKSRITKLSGVNKKTIERNRKFLIAAILILGNGFNLMRSFVDIY